MMRFITAITVVSVVATALTSGSIVPAEEGTIADLFDFLPSEPAAEIFDGLPIDEGTFSDHEPHAERELTFRPFSRAYLKDNLFQYIFGNSTNTYNISISNCIGLNDMLGPYQFWNGSMKYDATFKDIKDDLDFGLSPSFRPRYAAQVLRNAELAREEIQSFLTEEVLVQDSSPAHLLSRRDYQFKSNGRLLALAMKTVFGVILGLVGAAITSYVQTTSAKLTAGVITGGGLVFTFSIIDIIREEGALTALEPEWMEKLASIIINAFLAMLRKVCLLDRGIPESGEVRLTATELQDHIDQMNEYTAWTDQTTPSSMNRFSIQALQDGRCDTSPV